MVTLQEVIETSFPNGVNIVIAFRELGEQLLIALEHGVQTDIVFTINNPDGNGIAVVVRNGRAIVEPLQMEVVAQEATDKARMCACNIARGLAAN